MKNTPLRVLIIGDTEDDAVLMTRELTRSGHDLVTERVTGDAGLRAALERPWDIALSDYSLPHFNALEALAIVQQHDPDLPFILVSGTIGEERAVEAMRRGARDYVMKDNLARLSAVVERELREVGERRKRKQAEQTVTRLGKILDQSPVEIYIMDPVSLRFLQVNQTALHNLGYSLEEMQRMSALDIKPEFTRRHFAEISAPLLNGTRDQIRFETPHRRKDGTTYPAEVQLQYSSSGTEPVFVAVIQDITERKQAEDALFREKERAQVTLQSIGDAVVTTDAQGLVTYLNPVAERLTGWGNDEAQGQPLPRVFNAIHEDTRAPLECPALQTLRERRIIEISAHTLLIRRDGVEFSVEDSTAPIFNRGGEIIGTVLVFHDVSHTRALANQIAYQARHDALTGLLNRREFELHLNQALESAHSEGKHHAVCYMDLDQLKVVNDTCGHVAGDELLKQLSARLQKHIRENDILARFGGDEFTVLLQGCPPDKAYEIAEALRSATNESRFVWEDKSFEMSMSIGLVPITADSGSAVDIMAAADSACYVAKDHGRNRVHVYRRDDSALAERHSEMQWVGRLQKALEENSFYLYYQTILPLNANVSPGARYEILLRMKSGDGDLVPPNAFIPAAERYNLMPAVDRWVIRHALQALSAQNPGHALHTCALNLSGQSLCDDRFLDFVIDEVSQAGITPGQICFEITETAAIANLSRAMRFISTLKGMGCRFALDDFGSGLSSFAYLKNLPVDYLKIDGGFVRDMVHDPIDYAMVESINQIGHVMRIQTIAESVESEDVLAALKKLGVDYAQGYAIMQPRPWLPASGADTGRNPPQ